MTSRLLFALEEAARKAAPKTAPGGAATPTAGATPSVPAATSTSKAPSVGLAQASKVTAKVAVPSSNLDTRTTQVEHVLDNMLASHGTGMLLTGGTGIGKTTFIKDLGRLLGMPVFLVEAPHVTEEHVINIPFISFDNSTPNGKASSINVTAGGYRVQLAKSYLAVRLHQARAVPDAQLLNSMHSASANLQKLWENLGGTPDDIPEEIVQLRKKYKVILFLDEFFRSTTANVRNILRGILNQMIGEDRLPAGTYVIYASNMVDTSGSLEPVSLHTDFKELEYTPPTKDEFMHFFVSKFEKDTEVPLKPEVVNAFAAALKDKHIAYDDVASEIRTSPRRWEQIMLYVNSNVPVQSEKDARALLSNVAAQFQYGNANSDLLDFTMNIVKKIIAATSGEEMAQISPLAKTDWHDTLMHQIQTKMKLGERRTYVPLVAGLPGIGKTSQMVEVAQELNMLLISIECTTLLPEDITGIAIPKKEDDGMAVQFSEPKLYMRIMKEIAEDTSAYMSDPNVSKERKTAFAKQPYKYLIFFDEFNRVENPNVFNSLRRLILEKSFNDEVKLPEDALVVAAMNPYDKATMELTGHMRDAMDYIDTAPHWGRMLNYLKNIAENKPELKDAPTKAKEVAFDVIRSFGEKFGLKTATADIPGAARQFYINYNPEGKATDNFVYLSPREYSTMFQDVVMGLRRRIRKGLSSGTEQYVEEIASAIYEKMRHTLNFVFKHKHEVDSPQFMKLFRSWLTQQCQKYLEKQRTLATFEEMLDTVMTDHSKHLRSDPDFVNYANNFNRNKFEEDISNYLDKMLSQAKRPVDVALKRAYPNKRLEAAKMTAAENLINQYEYMENELLMAADAHNLSNDFRDAVRNLRFTLGKKLDALVLTPEEFTLVYNYLNKLSHEHVKGMR